MSKFIIFPNSYIQSDMLLLKPYAVSLTRLRPETWMNDIQKIKCIKNNATRNNAGVVLFDNMHEAVIFANLYGGYITNLNTGLVVHENHWATAFDPVGGAILVKFTTNSYGHNLNTLNWCDCTFMHYDGPHPSLRTTTYLTLPEVKQMLRPKK